MKKAQAPSFISSFLLVLLLSWNPIAISQEVEDEKEFSYEEGSPNGPDHWGEIHEEWAACNNGDMQSPIDLTHERVKILPGLGRLKRSYKASNATLKNRGHDIMLTEYIKEVADTEEEETNVGMVDPRHIKIGILNNLLWVIESRVSKMDLGMGLHGGLAGGIGVDAGTGGFSAFGSESGSGSTWK
ncbi:hypothetical protein COCNU_07G010420 [Cocos nucifera]|uniref:Alpha-carbonic anhydrase domain-containing protein n=1 Tax=Cocos nucifera TaxID=13894 RepID=A0A8K0IFI2_COCNU|nr:hypothetical protein COCNU_07G010420 [Cocos nucifera]